MGPGLTKASNSSLLRAAAAAIQTTPKASAKNQASAEPSPGTLSAKNHPAASTQKIAPTHHNSCHADDALMPPSTAASRSAPPRRPCLTPPRKPEGCPHEEGFDRPVHAVARAARSCWHSPDHLPLYFTECGSPVFGFCIRLYGICYPVEMVDAPDKHRK